LFWADFGDSLIAGLRCDAGKSVARWFGDSAVLTAQAGNIVIRAKVVLEWFAGEMSASGSSFDKADDVGTSRAVVRIGAESDRSTAVGRERGIDAQGSLTA